MVEGVVEGVGAGASGDGEGSGGGEGGAGDVRGARGEGGGGGGEGGAGAGSGWVYSFNPGVEAEAAGRSPTKSFLTLRHDLAALPWLLAGPARNRSQRSLNTFANGFS
jgi:hypothetical protein